MKNSDFRKLEQYLSSFHNIKLGKIGKKWDKPYFEPFQAQNEPFFLTIFGQKGQFWTVFGQNEQMRIFQTSTWNIFVAITSPK